MNIKEIKCDFIIYDVLNHHEHKKALLELIDKIPNNPFKDISKTDWNLPVTFEREYLNYFFSHIAKNIMEKQKDHFKADTWEIDKTWFQQYEKEALHADHWHPMSNFTNIYFVEFPEEQFKTSIKSQGKEYDYSVKEGQIITFPAHLLHCSNSNGDLRKTIISFNSNFKLYPL